jgi:hypothetical protein
MKRSLKNRLLAQTLLCALTMLAMTGMAQGDLFLPQKYDESLDHPWKLEKMNPDDDWTRHFRIGGMIGFNIKGSFKITGGSFTPSYADGVYDDGYVHLDSRNDPTETSYFGYNNSSQYDGSTLTMHRANTVSLTGGAGGSGNADLSAGFDLAYGDSYWYWAHGKLGWEFGFGLMPIHIANTATIPSATVTPTEYQFDASGNFYFPPNYQGVYENDNNSPDLPNIDPTPVQINGSPIPATGISTGNLDVMLYAVRLGPTLYWDWSERFGFYAGAGPAVGLVSGNLGYNDSITYNPNYPNPGDTVTIRAHSSVSGTSLTYGGYVNATLVYHAVAGGDFYLGAQFMPLSSATISGGGRSGKLNLSGQLYITAGINWPF